MVLVEHNNLRHATQLVLLLDEVETLLRIFHFLLRLLLAEDQLGQYGRILFFDGHLGIDPAKLRVVQIKLLELDEVALARNKDNLEGARVSNRLILDSD